MRHLIIGTGLTLVGISGAVSAAPEKPTPAGAVAVTEGKRPASAQSDKIKLTDSASVDIKMQQAKIKFKAPASTANSAHKEVFGSDHIK
jgi:hypothetical protein